MKEISLSIRTEKKTSKNFVKDYNHSNRKVENIDDKFIGKNINKNKIKNNKFLVDTDFFDNVKNIDEVWEIIESDYKNRTDNLRDIKYKLKQEVNPETGKKQFKKDENGEYVFLLDDNGNKQIDPYKSKKNSRKLQRTTNQKINVNGVKETERVETSPVHEHIIYLGSKDDIVFKEEYQYTEYYKYMLEEFNKIVDGQTVKAVVHFDEATPHLHIFQSQYNFENGKFETDFNKDRNNYNKLQKHLKFQSNQYLKKFGIKHKPKKEGKAKHLSVKEYKRLQEKIKTTDKDIDIKADKIIENILKNSESKNILKQFDIELLKKNLTKELKNQMKENYVNIDYEELKKDRAEYQSLKNEFDYLNNKLKDEIKNYEDTIAPNVEMVEEYFKVQKVKEKNVDELVEIKLKKEKELLSDKLKNDYESFYRNLLFKKNQEIEKQKKEIEKLNQKNQELQKIIEANENEIEEKIAIEVRTKISFNKSKEIQTKKEIEELKSKNEKLNISLSVVEKNIENKDKEIETLKSDIKKLQNNDTDKIIKDLKTKLGDANQKLLGENLLNDKIKKLEKKVIDLTIDNREFTKNEDLIEELKSKNTSLNTDLNLAKIDNIQNNELISSMVKGYIEGFQVIAHQERLEKINDNVQSTDNQNEQIKILIEENIKLYKDVEKEFDKYEEKIYRLENPNDNRNNNLHRQ